MTRRSWSKQAVIDAIHDWQRRGVPPERIWKEDPTLYGCGKRYFGSWRQAVLAAGFEPKRRSWSKEKVIAVIQARQRDQLPLRNLARLDPVSFATAIRLFGSWDEALHAAGVNLEPRLRWTRESIVARIHEWREQGVAPDKIHRQDRALVMASFKQFGSWRTALEAAGLPSERQKWSKERVIRELRDGQGNSRLVSASKRYFGSLHAALVAAGLRPTRKPRTHPTKNEVVAAIRARQQQCLSLSRTWRDDKQLYADAKRAFGSWREARAAAGFPLPVTQNWSREKVIHEITARRGSLQSVSRDYPELSNAAKRYFGNWGNALIAAGVEPRSQRTWTKRSVLDAIVQRHQAGLRLSGTWREDKPLFRAAVHKFGGWQQALEAAGFQANSCTKWSKRLVISELQSWYRHSNRGLWATQPNLANAAVRHFGSLEAAMQAADVESKGRKWDSRGVIAAIQDRHVRGLPVDRIERANRSLVWAARKYFGGWKHALDAAGLGHYYQATRPPRDWSRQRVVEELRTFHKQGRPVTKVWQLDPTLYSAAKQQFGTWRDALHAAGFKPSRRAWSKSLIVQEIRDRHEKGLSLNSRLPANNNLAAAAARYFGSWRKAIQAAGVAKQRKEGACHAKT